MIAIRPIAAFAASLALASCTTPPPASSPAPAASTEPASPLTYAGLGETVYVNGPKVTPLTVLEDSRCPVNVRCVWAGQVRLRIRVDLGSGSAEHEIKSRTPIRIADGTLELADVQPERVKEGGVATDATTGPYRFGFRFMGGL